MKKILFIAVAILPAVCLAQKDICEIKLDIDTVTARIAYLVYSIDGETTVDSPLIKNGKASFRIALPYPVIGRMSLDNKGYGFPNGQKPDLLTFYLEKGTMQIKTSGLLKNARITGSKMNRELAQYNRYIKEPVDILENGNYEFSMASMKDRSVLKDTAYVNDFNKRMRKAFGEMKELQESWIKTHPDTYCSLMALNSIAGSNIDLTIVDPLYNSLNPSLRNSVDGKELAARIDAARQTRLGAQAPLFTQYDVNDHPLKLSDFRGKYVLLDFWASWCGPCRAENPNYVQAYNKYKDRNFTLLGVSLDRPGQKAAWLAAIEKDGLEWPQVSDLNYWNNAVAKLYDVKAVPTNYLIDPAGKIIAKNLRGEELNKKLEDILGNK